MVFLPEQGSIQACRGESRQEDLESEAVHREQKKCLFGLGRIRACCVPLTESGSGDPEED